MALNEQILKVKQSLQKQIVTHFVIIARPNQKSRGKKKTLIDINQYPPTHVNMEIPYDISPQPIELQIAPQICNNCDNGSAEPENSEPNRSRNDEQLKNQGRDKA